VRESSAAFLITIVTLGLLTCPSYSQKTARFQYVFDEADRHAFFVHHLSNYEHVNHEAYGFDLAQSKTADLSSAAFRGECSAITSSTARYDPSSEGHRAPPLSKKTKRQPRLETIADLSSVGNRDEYLALVPFYGGQPPNTSAGAFQTDSLGQGNSRVSTEVKAQQAMATVCSCLRYFGHVVVGVARLEDRQQMRKLVLTCDYIADVLSGLKTLFLYIYADSRLVQLPPVAAPHKYRAVPAGETGASDIPHAGLGTALHQDTQLLAVHKTPSPVIQLISVLSSSSSPQWSWLT